MRIKALHIFSILFLTVGMTTTARAQEPHLKPTEKEEKDGITFNDQTYKPQSKIKIAGNVYGGGDKAAVKGNTNVEINTGEYGGSIFGGGNGELDADGVTVKHSADIGTHNDDGTLVENTGDTKVTINGGEIVYYLGDKDNFRNIYGGGNLACNVAGSTHVKMNKGMISAWSFVSSDYAIAAWQYFYDNHNSNTKKPICAVFGAGYGANTDVALDTHVDVNLGETRTEEYTKEDLVTANNFITHDLPNPALSQKFVTGVFGGGYNGTVGAYSGTLTNRNDDTNRTYGSNTHVNLTGSPYTFTIFGGGLGSKTAADADGNQWGSRVGAVFGGTKVNVQGGFVFGSIFGGGAGIYGTVHITSPREGDMPYINAAQVFRETDVTIDGAGTVVIGNVYGGGDIANTGWYTAGTRPTEKEHVEQVNMSLAKLDYTTSVHLLGGNVMGQVFGGANGRTKSEIALAHLIGAVIGSTNLQLGEDIDQTDGKPHGTTVWNRVYGGCNVGQVYSCEEIAANSGQSDKARAMANGVTDGCTNLAVYNGKVAHDIFAGGFGAVEMVDHDQDPTTPEQEFITSADISGNTYVHFKKGDLEWEHYWDAKTANYISQSSNIGHWGEEQDVCHNLYGGGNIACTVKGNSHVYMSGAPKAPADFTNGDYWKACIANVALPHFSVFGGGFGNEAKVKGNAYADINLQAGTGLHSIVGGGLNGSVGGTCNVHVGNDPMSMVHFVYGGGYYAPCAGTKLDITRGTILENVYGGAVMGNIHAAGTSTEVATNTTIGLQTPGKNADESDRYSTSEFIGEGDKVLRSYTYDQHQNKITILGDVYGGNDVSGTVNGIAQLTLYGGEVKGNVYGAGNGNHIGYYIPDALKYDLGTHGDDNYFMVDHSGEGGPKGKTYVGRPQTIGGVNLTLAGNTKEERVKVLGQVFGGGNSCTIGAWDKDLLAEKGDNPHLVRDDPDYFLGGGTLNINLGSHVTIGRTHEQLAIDADGKTYIDNNENVSGLFMGCSGRDLATQTGAYTEENRYHHFFSPFAHQYLPGFVVYDEKGNSASRAEQLKPFQAYLNNIMVWSDNVHLNIPDDAEDIWLANFVGGGFRGSMRAKTLENGRFDYTLPEGVTVSHTIIGGAYNAHVQYRVFATNDDGTFIDGDGDGKYDYLTVLPDGWTPMDPDHPEADCDYIKTLHEDEDDPDEVTGILRYNFNGGMLSINSTGVSSSEEGRHIHQVHADPRANEAEYATSYFEPMTAGSQGEEDEATKAKLYSANKRKALLHLTLKCALEPEVLPKENVGKGRETEYKAHGGNVFGGCFMSGFVEGDSWVDYHCWLAPKCANSTEDKYKYFFNKNDNMHIYDDAGDLETNNALSVYGAGYGADTHSDGDVYLYIKSIAHEAHGDMDPSGMFPYIFNAFGGSNMGTVTGNTNVYYAVGKQGTLLGSLYGGGYKGVIEGNTFVEMAEGFAHNVYGGSRQADIHGAAHVWAYDGKSRGIENANHLIICNLYGGNDIAGTISGTMPAKFTESKWNAAPNGDGKPRPSLTGKTFNTYVEISADDGSANRGFPLIGSAFAGGNGEAWKEGAGDEPNIGTALLEIEGGSTLRAFGGGNMATVTGNTYIFTNAESTNFANVTFNNYQKNIMSKVFFSGMKSGYKWEENTLTVDPYHVVRLFGGNNLATMEIQPTWNLWGGKIENVYSGGNMGDMTYYNPDGVMARKDGRLDQVLGVENADGTNVNLNPKGLSINIDSPNIQIGSLFGGCRMSDVKANDDAYDDANKWPDFANGGVDCYGATVNVIDGNIGYIFGGNDVSGKVEHGTNINICGGVIGQVYGSGNGDYQFKYIPTKTDENDKATYTDEEMADTRITEHRSDEYGIYYTVPEKDKNGDAWDDSSKGDTHKIMTINKIRPSVDNTFINVAGLPAIPASGTEGQPDYIPAHKGITLIKGNVYMGGNATTITRGNEEAFTKFKYGSYAVAGGLYMGSDGQDYTKDEIISIFAKLNGIEDMGASTQFKAGHEDDARHNPILLNAYLTAVDMNALPKEFAIPSTGLRETYVGTICGGGNRGSMLVDKTIDLVIPAQITIFDKIVAGCNNATINYNQNGKTIKSIGGYTRPVDIANNDGKGNVKINYNIAAQFIPLKLDVPMGVDLRVPVNRTDHNEGQETWADAIQHAFLANRVNSTGDAYTTGCNIYGGCYQSGEIEGDVVLNVHSNMLRYADEEKLKKAIANDEACFNVFGAGFGQESHVWGNVHIKLDKSENPRLAQPETTPIGSELLASKYLNGQNHMTTFNTPSVNNIFGGGRNGKLIGNTTIEIRNGRVYNDVAGGCFASDMYGSSHIIVGYPTYYKCNTSGEYDLQRGDQWNDDKGALKKSVKYLKGDLVPQNVYEQIVAKTPGNASKFTNATVAAPDDWSTVDIQIGKGVYGGGYSLANSTSASAGSITSHKLQATPSNPAELETLHPLNFDGRNGLEAELSTVGYGGNSAIMVGDQAGEGTADHIHISTLIATQTTIPAGGSVIGKFVREPNGKYTHQSDGTPVADTQYYDLSGDGGIYGDGHLTFCEGFRAADIYGYGYNTGTVKYPLLMNTFQRLDLLDVHDCCLMLQGAQDFATNEKIDATIYSMTRIGELRMKSSLDDSSALGQISAPEGNEDGTGQNLPHQRNYLGFFNNVHYLGSIVTNDDFASASFHGADGVLGSNSYKAEKSAYISAYADAPDDDKNNAAIEFKKRNVGTARNVIGINNGFCLRIQNQYKKDDGTYSLYYGPIVGVCEVKLLTLTQGEGGGYVYADNIHANKDNFLNTSGNFVFPGVVSQGDDGEGHPIADQYIVDDCFMDHFGTPNNITTRDPSHPLDEAHYWYVEGNKYFYQTTLTGYTFQDAIDFNLIDTDPNIVLSGMQNGSTLNIKKIEWLSQHRDEYECVLETTATEDDGHGNTIDKISDYQFDIEIAGTDDTNPDWTNLMPRHSTVSSPYTTGKLIQNNNLPQFNIKLQDKLDNSGDENYINHLDEPELVKIYLIGETNGQTYEYTITLNIVYLQGPTYEGGVTIENCALPGERIGFSSGGIAIKTPNLMPVTSASWQILPFKEIDNKGNWKWEDHGADIPKAQYSEDLNGHLSGWVPALYNHNEYNIAYIFTAGGHNFPVMPKQDASLKQHRMIVVHNYHRMKDIEDKGIEESVIAGACVYVKDEEDLAEFVAWVNAGKRSEGVHFILQDSIMLTSALPAITQPFAGTFHGDGYHINLNGKLTSLFGNKLTGKVYNLGMVGGTIASTGTSTNCYELKDSKDLNDFKVLYGSLAYELSHHFTPGDSYNADGYVESRYANGDYQYATTNHVWSLRTADPYYGHTDTHHDMAHTHDADRWQDTDPDDSKNADILMHTGFNQPLYDGTKVIADVNIIDNLGNIIDRKLGLPKAYANDYLFFGQHLDALQGDGYPVHIAPIAPGEADYTKGGNRVYETGGYYRSKDDQKFYYNKDAWALAPTLTAIDYTNMTDEGDLAATMPTRFNVDSNADHDDDDSDSQVNYNNATTGHVSQNLLVYNQGEDVFDYVDVDESTEASVRYHNIVKDGEGNFATNYLHLVDKQDFNAPIAFSVPERIWYERTPAQYRNPSHGQCAWEGICLPFTAKRVVADVNGEISHFYGNSDLNHEYWLRGLTAVANNKATFCRVGKEGTEGTFVDSRQEEVIEKYNYKNKYFANMTHYQDVDNFGKHYADAAKPEGVIFANYIPLTASVPYIIALPGNDYYEFSMEGSDYSLATHSKTGNPQAATFENCEGTVIAISDEDDDEDDDDRYRHIGSYIHTTGDYTLDGDGNAFVDQNNGNEVLPFRTYIMKPAAGNGAAPHRLLIEDWNKKPIEEEPEEAIEDLKISVHGRTIVVESPFELPVDIQVHTLSGHLVYRHTATKGITSFTLPQAGIYLIGRKKISVH